ncbi:hypothetical protein Ac2012v2_8332 [Leucoagaricus gongylophorus]
MVSWYQYSTNLLMYSFESLIIADGVASTFSGVGLGFLSVKTPSRPIMVLASCLSFGFSSFVVVLFCLLSCDFWCALIVCPHRNRRVVKRNVMIIWVGIIVVVGSIEVGY